MNKLDLQAVGNIVSIDVNILFMNTDDSHLACVAKKSDKEQHRNDLWMSLRAGKTVTVLQ